MATTTVYTFEATDPRTRLTWEGETYRAVRIERGNDGLSVWVVRTTRSGADFKRPNSFVWLTLANSLDRVEDGRALAAYVRELVP